MPLSEHDLDKLRYIRVQFASKEVEQKALKILDRFNLPIWFSNGVYRLAPSQRRALTEEGITLLILP